MVANNTFQTKIKFLRVAYATVRAAMREAPAAEDFEEAAHILGLPKHPEYGDPLLTHEIVWATNALLPYEGLDGPKRRQIREAFRPFGINL